MGLVSRYFCFTTDKSNKIRVCVNFYKYLPICKNLKTISTPSRTFHVSYKALVLLHNRTLNSVYLLSTPAGLVTHLDAIKDKTGGKILTLLTV
jgi:ribosomal protein S8